MTSMVQEKVLSPLALQWTMLQGKIECVSLLMPEEELVNNEVLFFK